MRVLAFALLAALVSVTGCDRKVASVAPTPTPIPERKQLAIPDTGAYAGAYMDFGEREDDVTLEGIENFEELTGKRYAIIASSSYWGEQTFPTANVELIKRHGAVPLVFWSPWDRPYKEDAGPDRFALTRILAGEWDEYIDAWGRAAAALDYPLLVSFGNEPNGTWFPWSGCFYGGGNPGSEPGKFAGPETYAKTWRYIVDRVRKQHATNVQWVFHMMNYPYPGEEWNQSIQYYPGDEYVDWIGLSVYGKQFVDEDWCDFQPLIEWPYQQLTAAIPNKPFMTVEWGVGEYPGGEKPDFIRDALNMQLKYPRLKAAVFWHERWQNEDGRFSNLRVNSTRAALAAYKAGIANPLWLSAPIWKTSH